jgi:hypothetical protein
MEDLTSWLTETRLSGASYDQVYESLADELAHAAERFTGFIWTDATRGYVHQLAYCMHRWVKACKIASELRDVQTIAA